MTSPTMSFTSLLEGPNEIGQNSVRGAGKKVKGLKEPISERELTTREKIIVLEASKLHGCRFLPWTSPPIPSVFEQLSGQPYFM